MRRHGGRELSDERILGNSDFLEQIIKESDDRLWSERFKSVIVDNGETLIHCLAYIDLNPIRAGIVKKPEQYRYDQLFCQA